jgi:hypothetical protein
MVWPYLISSPIFTTQIPALLTILVQSSFKNLLQSPLARQVNSFQRLTAQTENQQLLFPSTTHSSSFLHPSSTHHPHNTTTTPLTQLNSFSYWSRTSSLQHPSRISSNFMFHVLNSSLLHMSQICLASGPACSLSIHRYSLITKFPALLNQLLRAAFWSTPMKKMAAIP